MTANDLRLEICRVGKSLFERGYVHATAGNISARLPQDQGGGYLITPTDACLGHLEPAQLAHVDAQGVQVAGDKASKTLVLHRRLYDATAQTANPAGCVIHTHSTHCVALTLEHHGPELLPALTPYFVMKVGRVPVVPYHRPGDPAVADRVAELVVRYQQEGRPIRAVVLSRLGPNVWHHTPAQAMGVLEELEETARLWSLVGGRAGALTDAAVSDLRRHFDAHW